MSIAKSELTCNICSLVLSTSPVTLPCASVICGEHLRDDSIIKNGMIRCQKCGKDVDVPLNGFPSNKKVAGILEKELYLSNEEKSIKSAIRELIKNLAQLQIDVKLKQNVMEVTCFDHFSEIRRQIDIRREEHNSHEIALKLIDETKDREKAFSSKLKEAISGVIHTDLAKCTQLMENEFRRPNLLIEEVARLKEEFAQKFAEFEARISEFESLGDEIKSLKFKTDCVFGYLNANGIIAVSVKDTIEIWNLDSNECVAILEGHTGYVVRLENIDENRFASGSCDNTIRIWDVNYFVCLKTIVTDHLDDGVFGLKSLSSNRLASGSRGDIKIWNLETGECMQTLNPPSIYFDYIGCLASLPNGNLVSSGHEDSIKVWDLFKGEIKRSKVIQMEFMISSFIEKWPFGELFFRSNY